MKNLFAVKYYSTSTLLADKNTTPTLNPTPPTTTLDPTLFENWTKEEVCSLLCTDEGKGGASLTVEKAKLLYDAGFDGTSLSNIVSNIQKRDEFFALEQVKTNRDYQSISQTTLESVVNWVDNLLKTRLEYHLWSTEQVKENLIRAESHGGVGLTKDELATLTNTCDNFDGKAFSDLVEQLIAVTNEENLSTTYIKIKRWAVRNRQIGYVQDEFKLLHLTGEYKDNHKDIYLRHFKDMITVTEHSKEMLDQIKEHKKQAIQALGSLANPDAVWPYVYSGSNIKLDWRFSDKLIGSNYEETELHNIVPTTDIKTIHSFLLHTIERTRIYLLLALSGAGKSHSIFHLSTSDTAFIIPIDLGSYEDSEKSITKDVRSMLEKYSDFLQENIDENTRKKNEKVVKNLEKILVNGYLSRAILLLKFLETGSRKGNKLLPSDWIQFLYNRGSNIATQMFDSLNRYECGNLQFLKHVLSEIRLMTNKQLVLTLDELNAIIDMGAKTNAIPRKTSSDKYPASVATLLFRVLEDMQGEGYTSVVSGTKISCGLLEAIISKRYKEKIEKISYYGLSGADQLYKFAKRFISSPNIGVDGKQRVGGDTLLYGICTLLEGRRRPFANFMTNIVSKALSVDKNCKYWESQLLIDALIPIFAHSQVKIDIDNFLQGENEIISNIKKDVIIHLICKTKITKTEFEMIKQKYRKYMSNDHTWLKLTSDLIFSGITFGSFKGDSFQLKETFLALQTFPIGIDDMAKFVNNWLQELLVLDGPQRNNDIKVVFEVLGALILMKISTQVPEPNICSHILFSKYSNTFLNECTLHPLKGIIHNNNYWKALLMFNHHQFPGRQDFMNVCAVSLDRGLHVDVLSSMEKISQDPLKCERYDIALSSKLTITKGQNSFKENIKATNLLNGFLQNDGKNIIPRKEQQREVLLNMLGKDVNGKYNPSLRISFSYFATQSEVNSLDKYVDAEDFSMKSEKDVVVCWSRNDKTFKNWFKNNFPQIFKTLENHCDKKKPVKRIR